MARTDETAAAWVDMVMGRLHSAEHRVDEVEADNRRLRDDNDSLRSAVLAVKKKVQFAPAFERSVDYFFAIPMHEDGCPPIAELARSLHPIYNSFVMAFMPHSCTLVALVYNTLESPFQSRADASQVFSASLVASGCELAERGAEVYGVRCGVACEAVISTLDDHAYRNSAHAELYMGYTGEELQEPRAMDVGTLVNVYKQVCESGGSLTYVREFVASVHLHRHLKAAECVAAIQTISDCVAGNLP